MQFPLDIKAMRLALGLDQEKMANLFGISRAQLSMAESERRNLPTRALLRFNQINTLLENYGSSYSAISTISVESKKELLSGLLNLLKAEENKLLRKQKQLLSQQNSGNLLGALLSQFEVLQSPDFDPEGDRLWAETINADLPEQNKEKEWQEIYKMTLELEALRFKIEQIDQELIKAKA